jgi:hypothetical protein
MRAPKDFPTDMSRLDELLTKRGIEHKLKTHPGADEGVKALIGYNPAGDWQIIIEQPEGTYSVIRGMASFGDYEIMGLNANAKWSDNPARFETPQELVESLG